jgi:hypothetical protein
MHLKLAKAEMVRYDENYRAKYDPDHTKSTACDFHFPAPEDKVVVDTDTDLVLVLPFVLVGVPQSSRKKKSCSRGNTPHKVGEEKCEESKAKTANFGKD